MATYTDMINMSNEDLVNQLKEAEESILRLTLDHSVKGLENPLEIRKVRRNIAQIKTAMRTKEIEAGGAELQASRSKLRARRRK